MTFAGESKDLRQRGRSSKSCQKSDGRAQSYWLGEIFIDYAGCAWATELVERTPVEGRKCWEALPIYLGRAGHIVPIIKGEKPIREDMHPRLKAVLVRIAGDVGKENIRSNKHNDRTQGFSFGKGTRRSFRGDYRYGI